MYKNIKFIHLSPITNSGKRIKLLYKNGKLIHFYFVRSGFINLPGVSGATFRYTGQWGSIWSSRAIDYTSIISATAYNIDFKATTVSASSGPDERWYGLSLRCLSTVLDM